MNETLARQLRLRVEGPWELLATAAGNPVAVENACKMLSKPVLDNNIHPDWMIKERVDAVAAYDPMALASLAREWPKPTTATSSLLRFAWQAGLRHLIPFLPLRPEDFSVPAFACEISILWHADTTTPITWDEAFREMDDKPVFDYALVRRLSRRPLVGPLPSIVELQDSPPGMLRLLRGNSHRLSCLAQDYIMECAWRCLSADLAPGANSVQESIIDPSTGKFTVTKSVKYIPLGTLTLEGHATATLPIVELCREFNPNVIDELGNRFAAQLPGLTNPKLAAPLVYLLLTSWTLP